MDIAALTLVRPVPWAQTVGGLPFQPDKWGDRLIRIAAPGGTQFLVRRRFAPELPLWVPTELTPAAGKPFGLHLHVDRRHSDRVRATMNFRRAVGRGAPLRPQPFRHAHRHAVMLCIHDLATSGASLRDIAGQLLDPMPDDWRSSSERSDLRRLAEVAADMVTGGYRHLLRP